MEMCPSTVWHLVFHYFAWCKGTINVTFTLKTLLGHVYVQLLTYDVCVHYLTLSPRLLTNVLLKTCSHTRAHIFVTKTYLYPFFCHMRLMSVSRTFPLLLLERMSLHNFWHTRKRFEHFVSTNMSATSSTQSSVYAYVFLRERVPLAATNGLWHIFNVNDMSLHTKRWELGLGLDL